MIREPESKSFLAKQASEKKTQPKGWVFLLTEKREKVREFMKSFPNTSLVFQG
jgi:hypothetical protein